MEASEREYHDRVMALVARLNDMRGDGEFSVWVNALLTQLALAGMQSTLTKDEYQAAISWQLGEIMSRMTVSETPLQ
jgi:hypothetical protein